MSTRFDPHEELAAEYFLVGMRPVKYVLLANGGADVQAFDWQTGHFVRAMTYLSRIHGGDPEVDAVDADTFARQVIHLRRDLAAERAVKVVSTGAARPATADEVHNLAVFNDSGKSITQITGDRQDIVYNWQVHGIAPHGGRHRVWLVTPAGEGLAYAYVAGDGEHFGQARVPSNDELVAWLSGNA